MSGITATWQGIALNVHLECRYSSIHGQRAPCSSERVDHSILSSRNVCRYMYGIVTYIPCNPNNARTNTTLPPFYRRLHLSYNRRYQPFKLYRDTYTPSRLESTNNDRRTGRSFVVEFPKHNTTSTLTRLTQSPSLQVPHPPSTRHPYPSKTNRKASINHCHCNDANTTTDEGLQFVHFGQ
jgi:hypothetical protein